MSSLKTTARIAGLLYVVMSITAVFGYLYVPSLFIVPGDAAATVRKITEGALLYRASILVSLAGQMLFLFVVLSLYTLFKDVDRTLAILMVVLVSVGVAAEMVTIANRLAPLMLSSGADFLSVFTKPQLDALAYGFLRLGNNLGQVVVVIWGLWLFPFGILTFKSGFFPKVLGVLLMMAGFGYVVSCVASVVFPAQLPLVTRFVMPLYFGELPIIFWLVYPGAKVPQPAAQPSPAN